MQTTFLYSGNNLPTNRFSFGFYGGGGGTLTIYNSTSTSATLNTSLSVTNSVAIAGTTNPAIIVTGSSSDATFGVATAAGQLSTSAAIGDAVIRNYNATTSKALHLQSGAGAAAITIATGNAVYVNTSLNLSTDTGGTPKISMYGAAPNNFQYDGFATLTNTLVYHVSSTTSRHVFYAGTSTTARTELFRVNGTGGFTSTGNSTITGDFGVSGFVAASPRYGTRGKSSNQLINAFTASPLTWNDTAASSVISSDGTSLTNASGSTLVLYVSYCITWDVLFGGGIVGGYIKNTTTNGIYITMKTQLSPTDYVTASASGVIVLPNSESIACFATNLTSINLSVLGTGNIVLNSCVMSYYIMN